MIERLDSIFSPVNWQTQSADELATALSQPVAMTPMTLTQFFGASMQAGGNAEKLGELGDVWGGRWLNRASEAIAAGDLEDVSGLLAALPAKARAAVGAAGLTAVGAVVASATINAGGRAEAFTAEEVTEALTEADYTWNDSEWVYSQG
jgi:hypothetical protein